MSRVDALILAAGGGRRYGTPKALAQIDGETFLKRIVTTAREAGVDRAVVVIGAAAEQVRARHAGLGLTWVVNDAWSTTSMIDSLALGLRHTGTRVLVWPVDVPAITVRTIRTLVESSAGVGRAAFRPRFAARPGHPTLLVDHVTAIEARASKDTLRSVIERTGGWRDVDVSDPAVIENRNVPVAST